MNLLSIFNQIIKSNNMEDITNPFTDGFNIDTFKNLFEKYKPNLPSLGSGNDAIIELLNTNGLIRAVYEHYLFNIIPKSIANELFIINFDSVNKTSNIREIFDRISEKLNLLLYKIVNQIIINGGVGLYLVDKSSIAELLENKIPKFESIQDIVFESKQKHNKEKDKKTNANNIETILVHKSRIYEIKLLNLFTIGYIISGNLTEDLSKPKAETANVNVAGKSSDNNTIMTQLNDLFTMLNKLKINLTEEEKQNIINFVGKTEFLFIPSSDFVYIELDTPYNNGLLNNLEWHAKLLNIIRLLLANHAIKFQDLLIVKVDASEIAKPKVGEYLQAALTGLKSRLYTVDSNIPISSLPNLLTPLQIMFIPTYSGKDAINFETLTLNFNTDLANVLEQIRNDLASDSGIPYPLLINDQVDMQILVQLNGLFFQKIVYIQTIIEKGIKDYLDRLLYKIDSDTYFAIKDLYTFSLNKPIQAVMQQLSDIISNITNFSINLDNPKTMTILQRVLKQILGEDFAKLFDTTELEFKEIIDSKLKEILDKKPEPTETETNTSEFTF